jgi:hypothetical protein
MEIAEHVFTSSGCCSRPIKQQRTESKTELEKETEFKFSDEEEEVYSEEEEDEEEEELEKDTGSRSSSSSRSFKRTFNMNIVTQPKWKEKKREKKKDKNNKKRSIQPSFSFSKKPDDKDPDGGSGGGGITGLTFGALAAGISGVKTLEDAEVFINSQNETVHSFAGEVQECEGGFYSQGMMTVEKNIEMLWMFVLVIGIAIIFTIILNAYWPILRSINSISNDILGQIQTILTILRGKIFVRVNKEFINGAIEMSQSQKKGSLKKEDKKELDDLKKQLQKEEDEREDKKKSKNRKEWCLCIWLIICAIATFLASILIAGGLVTIYQTTRPEEFEQICKPMNKISSKRLNSRLVGNSESFGMVSIVSETTDSENNTWSVINIPCNASIIDELNNSWQVQGPFVLSCDDWSTLNYTTKIEYWHDGKCGNWPGVPDDWSPFPGTECKTANVKHCHSWNHWWKVKYRCYTKEISMQRCFWAEQRPIKLIMNGNEVNVSELEMSISSMIQTPIWLLA